MNYWLTTQWPREKDAPAQPYADVWAKDGKWNPIDQVAIGDMVFIYESKSGRLRLNPDGSAKQRTEGRAGVVALVRVTQPASAKGHPESSREEYDNGETMWWRYRALTESVNSGGFIPREKFLPLLGYKASWNLHGFGDNHSGIKKLTPEEFASLSELYQESADSDDLRRVKSNSQAGHLGGPGGEGPVHRDLKERIAANPSALLGEEGLTLYKMEFPFSCTGDRIDVILRDKDKKYVAVEVEVDCDPNHLAGPLQCMKYRSMLAYLFQRPVEEVRCILAAHTIASQVEARCTAFDIEVIEVARALR